VPDVRGVTIPTGGEQCPMLGRRASTSGIPVGRNRGGAEMQFVASAFTDMVSGESVGYYRDRKGVIWMKTSRWSRFKVRAADGIQRRLGSAAVQEESP
jgi:hypothetical protein